MKTGTPKLSTIYSFKGWRIPTPFLIIEKADEHHQAVSPEQVYTGITRTGNKLFIINLNDERYHRFFREYMTDQHTY